MKPKILIVEDHPSLRKLVRLTVAKSEFEVFEAADSDTAWGIIAAERPDIVLLDVMMPGEVDGFGVCSRIKTESGFEHVRVVLLTARGQKADLEEGERVGADAYLVKPFSPLELMEVVNKFLKERSHDDCHA